MMKRISLMVLAVGLVAMLAIAATNQVESVNVVGYNTVTVPSNGFALVTLNWEDLAAGDLTISNLVGSQLPTGSRAYIWDRVNKTYIAESRTRSGWGTNVISRGDGFWLNVPAGSAQASEYKVTLSGEVPRKTVAPTTTVANITGVDAMGYPYPVDLTWTNSQLAIGAGTGARLYVWNVSNQTYSAYSKGRSGWSTPSDFKIKMGDAFWFVTTTNTTWSEPIPYNF